MGVNLLGRIRGVARLPPRPLAVVVMIAASLSAASLTTQPASANSAGLRYVDSSAVARSSHDTAHTPSGVWSQALELYDLAVLNVGGNAVINTMSCTSAGNCAAGGSYTDAAGKTQAFVTSEAAFPLQSIEVPGTATLNAGGNATVNAISCFSAGNCGAGGSYTDAAGNVQGFVVDEVNGVWGTAIEVVDPSSMPGTGTFGVNSISCTGPRDCTAVGEDLATSGNSAGYAVMETDGTWSNAVELTIRTAFGSGGTQLQTVSCNSPGSCSTVGNGVFPDKAAASGYASIPYGVEERNGEWGTPFQFPGLDSLNLGERAAVFDLSCTSPGNCSAGGNFANSAGTAVAFVDSEADGTWAVAQAVANVTRLTTGNSTVESISCSSLGYCGAIGTYTVGSLTEDFEVDEFQGIWLGAQELPGSSFFINGTGPGSGLIACVAAQTCVIAGYYYDRAGNLQAFTDYEFANAWGNPVEVPGTSALNVDGGAAVTAISCSPDSSCGAGGFFADSSAKLQAFITNMSPLFAAQAPLTVTSTHATLGTPLTLTSSGGSGTGFQFFSVVNGSASGCAVSPTNTLSATSTGTCLVTVSRSSDGTYLAASSPPTPVSFALPPRPHPLTIDFAASSSALSPAAKSELVALSKRLLRGASVTVTGSAMGNVQLAMQRANEVVHFLQGHVALHVRERATAKSQTNVVTVETTRQ